MLPRQTGREVERYDGLHLIHGSQYLFCVERQAVWVRKYRREIHKHSSLQSPDTSSFLCSILRVRVNLVIILLTQEFWAETGWGWLVSMLTTVDILTQFRDVIVLKL